MKLTLTQTELETAVKSYVENNGLSLEDKEIHLTFNEDGCEINLNPVEKPKRNRKTVIKTEEKIEEKTEEVIITEPVEETYLQESDSTNHTDELNTPDETSNTADNPFALFGN